MCFWTCSACLEAKWPNLQSKTWPNNLYFCLTLAFALFLESAIAEAFPKLEQLIIGEMDYDWSQVSMLKLICVLMIHVLAK